MSYVVLARKWRPQQLGDLLGQEHVTQILTNAIEADRIAHAFLFSGPRGVGKTSAARILAKALCCEAQEGPTPSPCGRCAQCTQITEGRSTDVFEIDAASHTGVDNVREIIDNVRYLPSSARYKIYVIDEVHMLSTGAFNALLKTLEEPPEHVKFVLATTDVHKVPVTILSRCQRYDFRRIAVSRIAERLSFILKEEGIDHDPSALIVVAREAGGSMRDAQSLLEQVLAFAGAQRLETGLVRQALGVVDAALVERAIEGLLNREPGVLLELVTEVHGRGLDLSRFLDAVIEQVRDLLAARIVKDPSTVLDRPQDEIEALKGRAKNETPATFERLFEQLCRVAETLGRSAHPRFALEVGLAGVAEAPPRVPLETLVGQLERMESLLGGRPSPPLGRGSRGPRGPSSGGSGRSASRQPAVPTPRPREPSSPAARKVRAPRSSDPQEPPPVSSENSMVPTAAVPTTPTFEPTPTVSLAQATPEVRGSASPPAPDEDGVKPSQSGSQTAGRPQKRPASSRPTTDVGSGARLRSSPPADGSDDPPGSPRASLPQTVVRRERESPDSIALVESSTSRSPSPPVDVAPLPGPTSSMDLEKGPVWAQRQDAFSRFVAEVRNRRPPLAATLVQIRPLTFEPGRVMFGVETAFDARKLADRGTKEALEGLLSDFFGVRTSFEVSTSAASVSARGSSLVRSGGAPSSEPPETLNEIEDAHREAVRAAKIEAARNHRAVKAIASVFGAEIANVRVLDEG